MAYGPTASRGARRRRAQHLGARQLSMAEAINEAIRSEMRRNEDIILLGQDIGVYGGTFGVYKGLFDEFGPERVRDGPLCEAATAGFGIGLALAGHPNDCRNRVHRFHHARDGCTCQPSRKDALLLRRPSEGSAHSAGTNR